MFWLEIGAALYLAMGVYSCWMYLTTWNVITPIWVWPIIVLTWPLVWTGGIVYPFR